MGYNEYRTDIYMKGEKQSREGAFTFMQAFMNEENWAFEYVPEKLRAAVVEKAGIDLDDFTDEDDE